MMGLGRNLEKLAITGGNRTNLSMTYDSDFEKPDIRLGGVPLPEQDLTWEFIPGVLPYSLYIRVPESMKATLAALGNPVTLSWWVQGEVAGKKETLDISIKNLYIVEARKISPFHWQFEIQDMRFLWRGEKITIKANRTLKQNTFGEGRQNLSAGDPAILRQPFDRYATYRYIDWSINNGKPYTVLELLKDAMFQLPGNRVSSWPSGINYIQENVTMEEEPAQNVLSTLCNWARVEIGIDANGYPYIYDIDDGTPARMEEFLPTSRKYLAGSSIFSEEKKRYRPKTIQVKFRKKQEIVLVAVPPSDYIYEKEQPLTVPSSTYVTADMIKEGRAVGCVNVVRLPQDTQVGSTWYQRGTYIPLKDFLTSISLTEDDVRTKWFGSMLEIYHGYVQPAGRANLGPNGEIDPQCLMRITAIRSCYRRLWMIDPYWRKKWESWEPTRCSILDPVSGYSAPSPVWQDLCIIPKIRFPSVKHITKKLWYSNAYNWIVSEKDATRANPHTAVSITMVDQDLGVFESSLPPLVYDVLQEIIPCAVDPLPLLNPVHQQFLWEKCALKSTFTFEAIISAVPAVDEDKKPTEKQYFVFNVNSTNTAEGPDIEYLSNVEVARFATTMGMSTATLGSGQLNATQLQTMVNADLPINLGYLTGIAQGEAARIDHSYNDRIGGIAIYPGVDTAKLKLFGHCRAIAINFSPRGLRTTYNCSSISPIPELFQRLPDNIMRYIYKQQPRTQ